MPYPIRQQQTRLKITRATRAANLEHIQRPLRFDIREHKQVLNHGWFQQFDAALVDTLLSAFEPSRHHESIYQYHPDGWQLSNREACKECEFFDVHTSKYSDPNSTIEYPPDYPAGERAVACLELIK